MTDAADREYRAELTTFQCKECYVYRPPPASSIGHRAEFWDVDHWLQVEIDCCPNLPQNMHLPETLTLISLSGSIGTGSQPQDRHE